MPLTPTISIVTTVYDARDYLPRTVQSILAQTFTDFELLLVEDGSPNGLRGTLRPACPDRSAHPGFSQAQRRTGFGRQCRAGQCPRHLHRLCRFRRPD